MQVLRDAEDHELVARVVSANDTVAFGELIRRHQSQVRNFLRRLSADLSLADDLAQDCFMHAWSKLQTYSGRGTFIGWLMSIAYTTFLQSRRRSKRYEEVLRDAAYVTDFKLRSYAEPADEQSDLHKLLAVLTEDERAVMILSYGCGLSHREISEATKQPVGTVKSVIHRSKEKIRNDFGIGNYQHG